MTAREIKLNHCIECMKTYLYSPSVTAALALWFLALGGTRAEGSTPRNATATASVVFGFVVNVQITDGGAGYLHTPAVGFSGGGGANAAAYAVMVGGVVTSIVITNAGYGYTNAPTVLITPAPKNTSLNVVRAPMLVVEGEPDYVVQLQYSDAVGTTNWTTITNMVLSSNRFVWADTTYPTPTNRFYRANTTSGDIPIRAGWYGFAQGASPWAARWTNRAERRMKRCIR